MTVGKFLVDMTEYMIFDTETSAPFAGKHPPQEFDVTTDKMAAIKQFEKRKAAGQKVKMYVRKIIVEEYTGEKEES